MDSNENVEFNNGYNGSSRVSRLYLTKIIKNGMLNKKDLRTVRKWLAENNVPIIKDTTGEFVIEQDFNLAYDAPIIKKLMGQYGNDWKTYYPYYTHNEAYKVIEIKKSPEPTARYQPKGNIALKYKNR